MAIDDPVAWWTLDEGTGTAAADTGADGLGADGVLTGGASWDTGQIGNAVDFDGSTGYIDCGSGDLGAYTSYTIAAWVNLDLSAGSGAFHSIFNASLTTIPANGINLYVQSSDGAIAIATATGAIASSVLVPDTTWSFIAVRGVRDASTGTIDVSLNGANWVNIFTGDTTFIDDIPSAPVNIGRWGAGLYYAAGLIDEVRVYDRTLDNSEIAALYAYTGAAVLDGEAGSFALSGQAAGLVTARKLTAEAGSFTLSGQDADPRVGTFIAGEAGAFTLGGQDAGLVTARRLAAEAGSFALSGPATGLSYSGGGLVADAGLFALSGQDAALSRTRRLMAGAGIFALRGRAIDLRRICPAITAPTTPLSVQKGWLQAAQANLAAMGFPDVRVYDDPPDNAPLPFVSMDLHQWIPMDGTDLYGFDHSFYASVWSNYRGKKEVMEIMDALYRALHDKRLLLENGAHVLCQVTDSRADRDADGQTYMGTMTCRIISHPRMG